MTRTTWSWIAAFILGSSLVGAMPASAQNATVPRLMITVQDDASVPPKLLERTKGETTRIFQNINVELIWLEHGDARFKDPSALKSVVTVHILSREMIDRMKKPDSVMGWAVPGTRFVKVSYSRIKAFSRRTELVSPTLRDNDTACLFGTSSLMRSDTCCFHGSAFAFRHHARIDGPAARDPWRALLHGGPGSRHPDKACSY